MAYDAYMQINTGAKPDPEGESTAADLKGPGWIEVYSFSLGASNPTTVSPGKGGLSAGRVSVSSFNIMKKTEMSSCDLFSACCVGQTYPKATVILRKAAGKSNKQQVFLQYDFTGVMVESIQWSGSSGGDDTPSESVSFAFATIKVSYNKQKELNGDLQPANNASWDLTKVTAS
jgi:type VI secretion system secreted protein Hcp